MTEFNLSQGKLCLSSISSRDTASYNSLQKKIFFSKADFPISQKELSQLRNKYKKKIEEYLRTICIYSFNSKPSKINLISNSTFHLVYEVRVKDKSLIIRISILSSIIHDLSLIKEAWLYEILKKKRIQKIKVFLVDVSRSIVPFDYIILEKITGATLFDLSTKKKLSLEFEKLGKYTKKIHKVKLDNFGQFNISEIINNSKGKGLNKTWKEYILTNFEEHIKICYRNKLIDKTEAFRIEKVVTGVITEEKIKEGVLLNGDLANHNVFYRSSRIAGIIDWEDSIVGDSIYDLAFWITGAYYDEEWIKPFLKGYGGFENNLGIMFWTYYLRISLAKSVARVKFEQNLTTKSIKFHKRINKGLEKLELLVKKY